MAKQTKKRAWYQVLGFSGTKYVPTTVENAHSVRVVTEDGKWIELSWDEVNQCFEVRSTGPMEVLHNVANKFTVKVR